MKEEVKEEVKEEDSEEEQEESELEEELEEEKEIVIKEEIRDLSNLLQPQIRSNSPSLEQVEVSDKPVFSLEQGLESETSIQKEEDEIKYANMSSDYNKSEEQEHSYESMKPISGPSHINMEKLGRGPEKIGRKAHLVQMKELEGPTESMRNYDVIQPGKTKELGEKTVFQEDLERRYENFN